MNALIIIIGSIVLSGFFSGMEIAFLASNKLRIELDKKQNPFSSKIISIFTKNPGQYITTMLIGNTIILVIYGIVISGLLEPFISKYIFSEAALLLVITLISTLIILFLAEFLPKTIFRINPNFALNLFYLPLFIFYILFYPIARFTISISNILLKNIFRIDINNDTNQYIFSKIDLGNLVNVSDGSSERTTEYESEIKYIKNVLEFSEAKVRDCMIPRNEIIALEMNATVEELKEKFIESGFSKILIYNHSIDNIIGYINSKELFKNPATVKSKIIKCITVPETMRANKLLNMFMQQNKSIALVVDEFGGISGLITIEDIIEEILGDIEDEHDVVELFEKQLSDKEYILSGRLEIDYLNEKYQLNIPECEEYDTLAGYILFHHQSFPVVNEIIEIDQFTFIIMKGSKTKLELVKLNINS